MVFPFQAQEVDKVLLNTVCVFLSVNIVSPLPSGEGTVSIYPPPAFLKSEIIGVVNVLLVNVSVPVRVANVFVPVGNVKSLIVLPNVKTPVISQVPLTINFLEFVLLVVPNNTL